jgi:hypothetical protein
MSRHVVIEREGTTAIVLNGPTDPSDVTPLLN